MRSAMGISRARVPVRRVRRVRRGWPIEALFGGSPRTEVDEDAAQHSEDRGTARAAVQPDRDGLARMGAEETTPVSDLEAPLGRPDRRLGHRDAVQGALWKLGRGPEATPILERLDVCESRKGAEGDAEGQVQEVGQAGSGSGEWPASALGDLRTAQGRVSA